MNINRRVFLGTSSAVALGVGLAACGSEDSETAAESTSSSTTLEQPDPVAWEDLRDLAIPPEASYEQVGKVRTFNLVAQVGEAEIVPGMITAGTYGFNGPILGPTLRLRRGEEAAFHIENTLPEVTAVHWHGVKLPALMDGGPHTPIESGAAWDVHYTVDQPAATCWYHPHPHGMTGVQAYRGLAGLLLIDDEVSEQLDIPKEYAVDDIPLALTDVKLTDDGQLDTTVDETVGLLGPNVAVNGVHGVRFQAQTRRVRFRILDASTMRFHNIGFADGRSFHVIATDSGFLTQPYEATSVAIGPGERIEIVVDLEPEEEVMLRSLGFVDNLGVPDDDYSPDFLLRNVDDLVLLRGPADDAPAVVALPSGLDPAAATVPSSNGLTERDFELNTFEINNQMMDMARVDVTIDHDAPEIWEVTNGNSDWIHNFHIHNARFQVLEVSNTDVEFWHEGWKDTVMLPPSSTARLLVEFGYHPDPHYPYMYHCHMLYHEDEGMMGQYVIVEPGQKADLDTIYLQEHGEAGHGH
ncbi:MAG: multicopper oxidase domain-containing protein [Corynebacterium sp.]|nr:multicopper oxidase domain-containing protein [Corynebacterium sp.]